MSGPYPPRWADKTYYTQIALDLLTEGETEVMVGELLESQELPSELLRLVREKAEGNPLFIEEVTNALLERGAIVRHNGSFRWIGEVGIEVPATIQDIIRARIDRLEEPVKRTVQTAAVIGREFGVRLLSRISEMAEEVQRYLDTLKHLELIHEKRFFPELEFIFKHAVTQDVAYQSLLVQRRKDLHGAIGRALEDLYADRLVEQAAILAYHYARSEDQHKAIEYALMAGDQATRLYANAEATTYYQQALTMARALPASPEAQRSEIDATLKLAAVGMTRQDIERDRSNLERARTLAEDLHDEPRLARVFYWLGRIHYVLYDLKTSVAYAGQSLEIADQLGDDEIAAPPVNLMGRLYWGLSDFAKSSHLLERSAEQMARLGNKTEEATAAGFAGWSLASMGEFDRALALADRGVHLAQEVGNPFARAAAHLYRGCAQTQRGIWSRAIEDYQEATRLAEGVRDLFRLHIVKLWEGRARQMAGDPIRGRVLVEESLALGEQIGTWFSLGLQKIILADCLLALGEVDAIVPLCQEVIRWGEESGNKWVSGFAYRTLSEVYLRLYPSNAGKAEAAILESIRIHEEVCAKPELARNYASYARLLKAKGEVDKAKDHLVKALGMFQAMGMAWDLERAEQALQEF